MIGPRAVQALFQRSIHLSKQAHPELAISLDAELPLSNQVLLQTFRQLLGELIGPALSELLLQPALDRQL